MVIGLGSKLHNVYLVDFSCARKYTDETKKKILPPRRVGTMCGTLRYCSVNVHKQNEYGRSVSER